MALVKYASHGVRNGHACMGCRWGTAIANRSFDVKIYVRDMAASCNMARDGACAQHAIH